VGSTERSVGTAEIQSVIHRIMNMKLTFLCVTYCRSCQAMVHMSVVCVLLF